VSFNGLLAAVKFCL